jgi:hypothetical protein
LIRLIQPIVLLIASEDGLDQLIRLISRDGTGLG